MARGALTRREWFGAAAGVAALGASRSARAGARRALHPSVNGFPGPLCLFSKHLPSLGWSELGAVVSEAGFQGVDLTVRPRGHVDPARVAADLPKAVDAIQSRGIAVPMITTALTSADDTSADPILAAARLAGVRFVKLGYWSYGSGDVRADVARVGRDLAGLARLAARHGVVLGFHNHAGNVGAALWDVAPVLDSLDADTIGYYFDPRHAVVEGGAGAWKAAARLALPRLKMVAVKDAHFARDGGRWRDRNCPLGEGMVDWPWFVRTIAEAGFGGPVSLHLEYLPSDAPPDVVLAAARRDLTFLRARIAEARE